MSEGSKSLGKVSNHRKIKTLLCLAEFETMGTFCSAGPDLSVQPAGKVSAAVENQHLIELASHLRSHRLTVDDIFEFEGLSCSPAWDMLLQLFMSSAAGKDVTAAELCDRSGYTSASALRWLRVLEQHSLVMHYSGSLSSGAAFIRLTKKASAKVTQALMLF